MLLLPLALAAPLVVVGIALVRRRWFVFVFVFLLTAASVSALLLFPRVNWGIRRQDSWSVRVSTSNGFLNWDIFLYLPSQRYPKRGYGGTLERVQEWAYVHE